MVEINYQWQINKAGQFFELDNVAKEKFKSSKSRIFEIKAGNGNGKSFLIDLISFALELQNTDKISSQIKDKINRLGNERNSLSYDINLEFPDGRLFNFHKNENQNKSNITVNDNGGIINNYGVNNLHKDLDILYDIPQDPLSRLNLILRDINSYSGTFKEYFSQLHSSLDELVRKTNNTKDYNLIEQYKKEIKQHEKSLETEIGKKDKLMDLRKFINLSVVFDELYGLIIERKDLDKIKSENEILFNEFNSIDTSKSINETKITQLSSDLRKLETNYNILVSDNYSKKFIEFFKITSKDYLSDFKKENSIFCDRLSKIESQYIIALDDQILFKNLIDDIYQVKKSLVHFYKNSEDKDLSNLKESILGLQNVIDEIFVDKPKSELINKILGIDISLIKSKIDTKITELTGNENLRDFEFIQTFDTNLIEFVNNIYLKEKKAIDNKNRDILKLKSALENPIDDRLLHGVAEFNRSDSALKKIRISIDERIKKIYELRPSEMLDIDDFQNQIKSQEFVKKLRANYLNKIENLARELRFEEKNDLDVLSNNVDRLLKLKSTEIQSIELQLTISSSNLKKEELKADESLNSFQKIQLNKIFAFFNSTKTIPSKLLGQIKFDENGNLLKNKAKLDDLEKGFLKISGKLISKSLENKILWKDSNFLELETFDIVNGLFVTKDGTKIEKADFSVGQSSTIYLLQNIKKLYKKFNIILLDEIAQIDTVNKNLIIDEIKKINADNKLVLAILIRPSDDDNLGFQLIEIA